MPRSSKTNVPEEPLRWSLARASGEFALSVPTLRAGLAKNSSAPGEDGCFSTQQIVESIYGALHLEKIRTQRELTKKLQLENSITTGAVLNRRELERGFTQIAEAISARVMSCNELPRTAREDILRDLSSWPVVIEATADRQTPAPARG
jgi:hypothetical protein